MPTSTNETNKYIVIAKRKAVKELKAKHLNKTQIQRKLAVSADFVRKWWETDEINTDHRGWVKGKRRVYTQDDVHRVLLIREQLVKKKAIFYGPDAVRERYKQDFPAYKLPSRSLVTRTLKEHGILQQYRKRVKQGSVLPTLSCPEHHGSR